MSETDALDTGLVILAVLFSFPLVMMGIGMPLLFLSGWGPVAAGAGGWWLVLMPLVPLSFLLVVGYLLFAHFRPRGRHAGTE
jgi:H+/Cl- antiporter ClcA